MEGKLKYKEKREEKPKFDYKEIKLEMDILDKDELNR